MKTLRSFRVLLPLALTGIACSSILGIEEIHEDPKPGSGGNIGDGGDDGNGGTTGNRGGTGGATGGTAGTAGTPGGGTSGASGTAGTAGDAGGGGEGDTGGTGPGGSGGTGGADDMTVRGRLVSYWLTPMENVLITIGAADDITDENGEFEIPDVAPTYDVKFVVSFTWTNTPASYGYVYEGLTRRDPTLQTFRGAVENSGAVDISPTGAVEAPGRLLAISFGLTGGADESQDDSFTLWGVSNVYWEGGTSQTARWHGLVWDTDTNNELPTGYRSYATGSVALSTTETAMIAPDMTDRATPSGVVSGTVTSPTSIERTNNVYVHFTSNATIELLEQYGSTLPDPATFSYVVPTLPNGSVTISALEGYAYTGAAACAHRENLTAGQTGIAIAIPEPPTLVAPADVATADPTTPFRWASDPAVSLVHFENNVFEDPYVGIYVLTTRKQITIPTFSGFQLIEGHEHYWRVETHGDFANVDEATGPEGFADAMRSPYESSICDEPVGPRQGDGALTISAGRFFTPTP
jgi:hypothetical protein